MNKVSDITSSRDQPWRVFLVCLLGLAVVPLSCLISGFLGGMLAETLVPVRTFPRVEEWGVGHALVILIIGGVVGLVQAGFSLLLFAEYIRIRRLTWCALTFLMVVIGYGFLVPSVFGGNNDDMFTLVTAACCGVVIGAVQISLLRVRMKTVLVWPLFMSISWIVVVGIALFTAGIE